VQANIRILIVILALFLGAVLAPPLIAHAEQDVIVTDSQATADFPHAIEFTMTAVSSTEVETVQLFWKASGSAAYTLSQPEVTVGEALTATFTADMTTRYLPPGIDIEYFWRLTGVHGTVHESSVATLAYMDTRFEWQSLQAGSVSVWWYLGSVEYAEEIAHAANRTLLTLDGDFGVVSDAPIRIIVYGDDRDFSAALRPNSADWIGGVAYSSLGHIVAHIRPGPNAHREINRMIPHEVSHVAVYQASRNPYNSPPPWLDEGLATYVQYVGDTRLQPTLDRAARDGRLIPLGALKSSFPLDPDQALLSYAESVSIVTYLVETYGTQTVGELVTVYASEASHEDAVRSVLDMSITELDSEWKAWLGYAGDRTLDTGTGPTTLGLPRAVWYGGTLAMFAAATIGLVVALFWRTRSYAETDEDEEQTEPLSTPN
jgi:hypothetical protein